MRKLQKSRRKGIPMTTFLDVFLTLLVFPIVSMGHWVTEFNVDLASGSAAEEGVVVIRPGADNPLLVEVGRNGEIHMADRPVRLTEELRAELTHKWQRRIVRQVVVSVDGECAYQDEIDVLAFLKTAGIDRVSLHIQGEGTR